MGELWPLYEAKMKKEGLNDAAIAAFKYNYSVLTSGQDTMIPESSISPVDSLPSYESLNVTEDSSLLRPGINKSTPWAFDNLNCGFWTPFCEADGTSAAGGKGTLELASIDRRTLSSQRAPLIVIRNRSAIKSAPCAPRFAEVVLKLNGGLGTGMGLEKAKSLLPVKQGLTFLEWARHMSFHKFEQVSNQMCKPV